MPPLNSSYTKMVHKTTSYTLAVSDDIVDFTIAAPATATLPLSKDCTPYSGQNQKIIINNSASLLTIAVQAGNTLVGATAPAAVTLAIGETAFCFGNGITTWNVTGGAGVSGASGFSGVSGQSGFSGASGSSGFSGASGFSGTSGFSGVGGFSGVSGFSGASGVSGASGTSGFSGASGVTS